MSKQKALFHIRTGLKNTPGPWEIHEDDIGDDIACWVPLEIHGADGFTVVSAEGGLAPEGPWETETLLANANLIVSAPEMYESLKEIYEYMVERCKGDNFQPMLTRARIALDKAAGK